MMSMLYKMLSSALYKWGCCFTKVHSNFSVNMRLNCSVHVSCYIRRKGSNSNRKLYSLEQHVLLLQFSWSRWIMCQEGIKQPNLLKIIWHSSFPNIMSAYSSIKNMYMVKAPGASHSSQAALLSWARLRTQEYPRSGGRLPHSQQRVRCKGRKTRQRDCLQIEFDANSELGAGVRELLPPQLVQQVVLHCKSHSSLSQPPSALILMAPIGRDSVEAQGSCVRTGSIWFSLNSCVQVSKLIISFTFSSLINFDVQSDSERLDKFSEVLVEF